MIDNKRLGLNDQNLLNVLEKHILNTGGLAIKAASNPAAKTANTVYYMLNGQLRSKAAADMAAISGTILTAHSNVVVFSVDEDGNLSSTMGTAGATVATVVFPAVPGGEAVIGFIIITNATGSTFTGGTTALDVANLTVVYRDTPFPVYFAGQAR